MRKRLRLTDAEEESARLEYESTCARIDRALAGRKHLPEKEVIEAQKRKGVQQWQKKKSP